MGEAGGGFPIFKGKKAQHSSNSCGIIKSFAFKFLKKNTYFCTLLSQYCTLLNIFDVVSINTKKKYKEHTDKHSISAPFTLIYLNAKEEIFNMVE